MAHVFISYAREDREFVQQLSGDLRRGGIDVWMDVERIAAGASWQAEIESGILGSAALVYVSSEHSHDSVWMRDELQAVLRRDIQLFPVILDDTGAANLPSALGSIQWADFRQGYELGLEHLLAGMAHLRGRVPVEPSPVKSKGYAFISYAEEDAPFVQRLAAFMKEHGYALWEFQTSQRDYSGDLYEEIEGIVRGAVTTLSVVSPNWKKSKLTRQEFLFSREIGVPVFLLRIADPGPTLALAGIPYIDFSRDEASAFGKLDHELKRHGL